MIRKFGNYRNLFLLSVVVIPTLLLGFQNCAGNLPDSVSDSSQGGSSSIPVTLKPAEAKVPPNGKILIRSEGGFMSGAFVLVSGAGTLDTNSGLYTAPAVESQAKIGAQDFAGVWSYALVDVSTAAAAVTFSAKPATVVVTSQATYTATGGTPPYTYSAYPSSIATIDPNLGVLNALGAGTGFVFAMDANGLVASTPFTITGGTAGSRSLAYTGADQGFIVPAGITSLTVKMWGAGGGGCANPGGAGGYATAFIPVTPGETLTIVVAGGGSAGNNGSGTRRGGGGGGATAILRGNQALLVAAGGGGAAGEGGTCPGAPGGGVTGATSPSCINGSGNAGNTTGATGGSQTAPGVGSTGAYANGAPGVGHVGGNGGNTVAGSEGAGGWSSYGAGGKSGSRPGEGGGGGGGGGFFGGGGGAAAKWGTGGGGGSSYIPAGGTTAPGVGAMPGNSSDADRGTAGNGGGGQAAGANGLVRLTW